MNEALDSLLNDAALKDRLKKVSQAIQSRQGTKVGAEIIEQVALANAGK
jgi:UDP:flavonoid glycosyltransferase YjiC (YdhE family)